MGAHEVTLNTQMLLAFFHLFPPPAEREAQLTLPCKKLLLSYFRNPQEAHMYVYENVFSHHLIDLPTHTPRWIEGSLRKTRLCYLCLGTHTGTLMLHPLGYPVFQYFTASHSESSVVPCCKYFSPIASHSHWFL